MRDLRKYYNSNQEEIRKVLGPPDDPADPELYQILVLDLAQQNNLRLLYNMRVKAQREIAGLQAEGILMPP